MHGGHALKLNGFSQAATLISCLFQLIDTPTVAILTTALRQKLFEAALKRLRVVLAEHEAAAVASPTPRTPLVSSLALPDRFSNLAWLCADLIPDVSCLTTCCLSNVSQRRFTDSEILGATGRSAAEGETEPKAKP